MRATRAFIQLDNLTRNIAELHAYMKFRSPRRRPLICLPVKADAYGHGAVEVAAAALAHGAAMLAVATVDEGITLRQNNINAPILLFSPVLPDELEGAARFNLIPFISDTEYLADFARALRRVNKQHKQPVYLKIDTGMGRGGCLPHDALPLARAICEQPGLTLAGTATHLSSADSDAPCGKAWTVEQLERFNAALRALRNGGIDPGIVSAANSAATLAMPESWFDMVRPGILLYGYQPGGRDDGAEIKVKPVMRLETQVLQIKHIKKGEPVSYGRTWFAPEDTYVGVLPAGYADGLPRRLSVEQDEEREPFFVVIGGECYPLAGRICMDQCMINLGRVLKVKLYDTAVLFGGGPPSLDAADIAVRTGTIPYEITCNINKRVPRLFTEESKSQIPAIK